MKHAHALSRTMIILLAALLLAAGHSRADTVFLPRLDGGWEVVEKEGRAQVYRLETAEEDCLCLRSESASFSVQRKVDVDVIKTPYLSWRWKVIDLPEGADFRKSSRDDQAAQLFVAFEDDRSISYIWDTTAPVGATGGQWIPWVMDVKILVVESGPKNLGRWVTYTRNVYEDYKKLFGGKPSRTKGLRFQINSQYTGTAAESCLERVEFRDKP